MTWKVFAWGIVCLQDAGYDNYLVGKFLNHYNEPRRARPGDKMFPNGWKHFDAITHKSTCRSVGFVRVAQERHIPCSKHCVASSCT